ncbi:MAG: radical SAM protein, partial [Desulfobacterales bacterium]|nr:radical SAM protein [Desulfobacterales bacterium]
MIISPPQPLSVSARHRGPAFGSNPRIPPDNRRFIRLATPEHEFWFQPDGDIRFIRGRTPAWPHPAEHLKRTDGNDWVYYWVGEDSSEDGIRSWAGEYYQPCLPYASNGVRSKNYYSDPVVMTAFAAWSQLYADLYTMDRGRFRPQALPAVERILGRDDTTLYRRSESLAGILGGRISVLPPDARYVDYDVIPLVIADGCRYRYRFCCVKSGGSFTPR